MFRRLAVFLRRGLFVVGVGLLVWWPVACFSALRVEFPRGLEVDAVTISDGCIRLLFYSDSPIPPELIAMGYERSFAVDGGLGAPGLELLPQWQSASGILAANLQIPLWLLAAACLAWPVTSFFLGRRGQGRGFDVEVVAPEP